MVISQIIGGLSVGGAEKHFVNLLNEFQKCECHALFLGKPQIGPTLNGQLGKHVEQKRIRIRKRSFAFGIQALTRELKRQRCDVVHTHMYEASLYGSVAARLAGVPVIVTTEHGENLWKRANHYWMERNIISRNADMRYCVSQDILDRRKDFDGVPANKLQLVANGTVVPDVPATIWDNPEPVVGSIGRFVSQKDFGLFVDVISKLRGRGYKIRGCIVGDGPEMQAIQERIAEQNLESIIELPGMVTDTEKWFRYFDIYAITSSQEGLPVSLLEAMSFALPVVASDVGAISSAVRSGEEGTIVGSGNMDQFADAIAKFLDDRELATNTGLQARERVVRDFSIESIAARYMAEYKKILSRQQQIA